MRVVAWPARKNADTNPYQRLLYDAVAASGTEVEEFCPNALMRVRRGDVLHLHWPDVYLAAGEGWRFWQRLAKLRGAVVLAQARGARVVWTAHNLRRPTQRNAAKLEKFFWPWFLRSLDGVIFMTEGSRHRALATEKDLRDTPTIVIPHGHYREVAAKHADNETRRPRVDGDEALTALFFGSVAAYKGVHRLVGAFDGVRGHPRLRVLGAHSSQAPDVALQPILASLASDVRDRIEVRDVFLAEAALVDAVRRADLVVLPYDEVDNSGSALFALSVGRPILVSDVAPFRELRQLVGDEWVWIYEGALTAAVLEVSLERARSLRDSKAVPDLAALDWDTLGRATTDFYRRTVDRRGETSDAPRRVRIVHETNPTKYFPALLDLAEQGRIDIVGLHRYSVVKEWLRAGLKDRTPWWTRTRHALGDAWFRLQVPFVSGETIVLGFAPWDWRLLVYRQLARRNRIILHTSWPDWADHHVPRSGGPLLGLRKRAWVGFLADSAVTVVCVMPQIRDELAERFGAAATVIPHAVPDVFFDQDPTRDDVGPLRLLYVGELSDKKGIPQLLALARDVAAEGVTLTLVGDGPLRGACEKASQEVPSIVVHGPERDRKRLAGMFGEHHVLMLLSQREGSWQELFGIVVVEAVAAGAVVVATDHIGPSALLGGWTPETLVDERSVRCAARLVRTLANDRALVARLAARQRPAADPFRMSAITHAWLRALNAGRDPEGQA
ncbi:GDP-mannose:glycolipid 4-beta-D-mannosyltransferase [Nocardioides aquaticus]|uniref:GDP-mannose:glycolipid 4-beta-D-mannosyltransferase n=2 Tax=Actinomycetes TaxID=1760 RepID=A0ABX8ED74_9ACTN|nr:glycosyltransferase [Nocardioides aquaticus]QVT78418.1 GDP-mannose:glycolipid 4-beta-D-mannosyltransferase [Nocardioides aquaticus]